MNSKVVLRQSYEIKLVFWTPGLRQSCFLFIDRRIEHFESVQESHRRIIFTIPSTDRSCGRHFSFFFFALRLVRLPESRMKLFSPVKCVCRQFQSLVAFTFCVYFQNKNDKTIWSFYFRHLCKNNARASHTFHRVSSRKFYFIFTRESNFSQTKPSKANRINKTEVQNLKVRYLVTLLHLYTQKFSNKYFE